MATNRRTPQLSIALQPDIKQDLEKATQQEQLPKATVMTKAVRLGLKQILNQYQQPQVASVETIMTELQQLRLDAFTPSNYYNVAPQVKAVLEKHLGHQPTPASPCPLEATELQEKINQIWEKVMGDDR